jgi:hypothetical protein
VAGREPAVVLGRDVLMALSEIQQVAAAYGSFGVTLWRAQIAVELAGLLLAHQADTAQARQDPSPERVNHIIPERRPKAQRLCRDCTNRVHDLAGGLPDEAASYLPALHD